MMIEEFNCKHCDFIAEYPNEDSPMECPDCGSKSYLLAFLKVSRIPVEFVSIGYKESCRYSVTMGVTETQIEQAKKLHPQVDWKKFGHSYRPLLKNRTDKLRMMKQCGMVEYEPSQFKGKD